MIIKVKEPLPEEYSLMRAGQLLFTYFHFAADEGLTRACLERGISALAYETVQEADGSLPLLKPMSEVAGRMAPIVGAYYLDRVRGGRGNLLPGVPGCRSRQCAHPRRRHGGKQRRPGSGGARRDGVRSWISI